MTSSCPFLQLSLPKFPTSARVKEGTGLPWGCAVVPFFDVASVLDSSVPQAVHGDLPADIARCSGCFGYINSLCRFDSRGNWFCVLCRTVNKAGERYENRDRRSSLPELSSRIVEFDVRSPRQLPATPRKGVAAGATGASLGLQVPDWPCVYFVVDISGGLEYAQAVQLGIQASLEALSPTVLVGLLVVGRDQAGLVKLNEPSLIQVDDDPARLPTSTWFASFTDDGHDTLPPLADVAPMADALADVATARNRIERVLQQWLDPSRTNTVDATKSSMASGISALLRLIDSWQQSVGAPPPAERDTAPLSKSAGAAPAVRLMCFFDHAADAGLASIDDTSLPPHVASARAIYHQLGDAASQLCVPVDAVVIGQSPRQLNVISGVVSGSGGLLYHYTSTDGPQMSQDLHKHFMKRAVLQGLLRLRTSSAFRISRAYGNVRADPDHAGLYTMTTASDHTAVYFNFEFDQGSSFDDMATGDVPAFPTIQMAFAYTLLLPSGGPSGQPRLVRRLRIVTHSALCTASPYDCCMSANPDVVLALLISKIIEVSATTPTADARLMLGDWVALFVERFIAALGLIAGRKETPNSVEQLVDRVSGHTISRTLCAYIFALLRNQLMLESSTDDDRARLQLLYRQLKPSLLARFVYPRASSWLSYNDQATSNMPLPLSRAHIVSADTPVVLVDSGSGVLVYTSLAARGLPERPDTNSRLAGTIAALRREERPNAVQVTYARAGGAHADEFEALMAEDGVRGAFNAEDTFAPAEATDAQKREVTLDASKSFKWFVQHVCEVTLLEKE